MVEPADESEWHKTDPEQEQDPMQKFFESINSPIYINEDLTRQRAHLAAACRNLKKASKITDTWTYDGTVFVKLKDNNIMRLTKTSDLQEQENKLSLKMTINLSQIQ